VVTATAVREKYGFPAFYVHTFTCISITSYL